MIWYSQLFIFCCLIICRHTVLWNCYTKGMLVLAPKIFVQAYLSLDSNKASSYNFILVQKNITCRNIDFYVWRYPVILKLKWKESVQQPTLKQKQSCWKDSHWLKHMKDYRMHLGGSSHPHSALTPFWLPDSVVLTNVFTQSF